MAHFTWRHSGQTLEQRHVTQLVALGKGCCEECGSLRAFQSRQCGWCGGATRCRQPRVGDTVVGRSSATSNHPSSVQQPETSIHIPVETWSSEDAWLAAAAQNGDVAQAPGIESGDGHQPAPAPQQQRGLTAPSRNLTLPPNLDEACLGISRSSAEHIPASLIPRYAVAWAECLEGLVTGDPTWSQLAKWRCRLLLCDIPRDSDRVTEIRERLCLWEMGDIQSLVVRVQSCALQNAEAARRTSPVIESWDQCGKRAKYKARQGAYRKSIMNFNGKMAEPTAQQKAEWAGMFIPRSTNDAPGSTAAEHARATANAHHHGDPAQARRELTEASGDDEGPPKMPHIKFAALTAPGPSGERPEHWTDCMSTKHAASKRRLTRALDALSVQMALGTIAPAASWILDTALIWLRKVVTEGDADEEAWLQQLRSGELDGMRLDDLEDVREEEVVLEPPAGNVTTVQPPASRHQGIHGEHSSSSVPVDPETSAVQRPKVRPIQMGEFLRKLLVRRTLHVNRLSLQKTMLSLRQWGVGAPGGAEAIAHSHLTLEALYNDGLLPRALLVLQVDYENFFGSLEWSYIRAAIQEELPQLAPATVWKHGQASYIQQEDARPYEKNRGAEQGDAAAAAETGASLGVMSRKARWDMHHKQANGELPVSTLASHAPGSEATRSFQDGFGQVLQNIDAWEGQSPSQRATDAQIHPGNAVVQNGGVADLWYMDDGTIVLNPALGVSFLRILDSRIVEAGGKRNFSKSNAILYATEQQRRDHAMEWKLDELAALCSLHGPEDELLTLGAALGGPEAQANLFRKRTGVVTAMHRRLHEIDDAAVEQVLGRACLSTAKMTHLLRLHGLELWEQREALEHFDRVQEAHLDRLFPGQDPESARQASLGTAVGGLGYRRAVDAALPAVVASLIMARPKVASFDKDLTTAGLLPQGLLLQHFDGRICRATSALQSILDTGEGAQLRDLLDLASARADAVWSAALDGRTPDENVTTPMVRWDPLAPGERGAPAPYSQEGIDDDRLPVPVVKTVISVGHAQKMLSMLLDNTLLRKHLASLCSADRNEDLRRLEELRHKSTDHTWTGHINYRTGTVMPQHDYIVAMQHRLGCSFLAEASVCKLCGEALDARACHASCCARAEATRGHYGIVKTLMTVIRVADASAATEVPGLAPSESNARPVDILTNAAVPGRGAALDVVVASQEALSAGTDCVATAVKRKLRRYRHILDDLEASGITFRPMAWSAEGRAHPIVRRVLAHVSQQVARTIPDAKAGDICKRWRQEIGTALALRMARMIRSCLPAVKGTAAKIVLGRRGG